MIHRYSTHYFIFACDKCGKTEMVYESSKIYNGAQAVRSLGWSFGRNKKILCCSCRSFRYKVKQ